MTSINKLALCVGMMISFLSVSVCAQSAGPEVNHFSSDWISFDYPSGFSLTDESTPEVQQLLITRQGSSVQLTIVVGRNLVLQKDLPAATENFSASLLKKVSLVVEQGKNPAERTTFHTQIWSKQVEGVRLRSAPTTGEVLWLRWNLRAVGVTLVRSDVDESVGAQLWQTVSSSLKIEAPVVTVMKPGEKPAPGAMIEGGVLNGKALELPPPAYPPIARAARAFGTVTVQVLIDEQGNVVSAHAVEGHPLLQSAAVAAARQARFSPTLLEGEPIKVTGVIKYKFDVRERAW
jgi:TonB family protein